METLAIGPHSIAPAACGLASDEPARNLSPACLQQHPRRGTSCSDTIRHVVHVHHPFLRERLAQLDALLTDIERASGTDDLDWRRTSRLFAKLQEDLVACLRHEEDSVFPQIEQWEANRAATSGTEPPPELMQAATALEHWHAGLLQTLWLVLRRARDAAEAPGKQELWSGFFAALSAVCDDFDQHLFEEDCLLLPQVTGCRIGRVRKAP